MTRHRRGRCDRPFIAFVRVYAMSAPTTSDTVEEATATQQPQESEPHETQPRKSAGVDDWLTAGVVFGILGGCLALWIGDLSLVAGTAAAVFSGVAGILFADA